MDIQQVRYFVSVAKAGSFVKAAEAEGVSQPAISQQVARLEADLGAPLFLRMGRLLRLTPLGTDLLAQGEELLRQAALIRQTVKTYNDGARGRVTVGSIPTVLPYFLAPRLPRLALTHPEIEVTLIEGQTAKLMDLLRAAEIDLAVLALPIKNQEIVCSDLFREELFLAVPPGRVLAGPVDIATLRGERLLLLREGNCLRDNVLTACSRARTDFERVFESDQLGSIFSLVAAGYGISLVPELAIAHHAGCGSAPVAPKAYRRIGYALARGNRPSAVRRTFIQWLKREAAQAAAR